jgi:hypothetical protein
MTGPVPRTVAWMVRALAAALLVSACGCGKPGGTVNGRISYRGHPVTYGSVILVSADGTSHSGSIKPDGSYTVNRVPPGAVKIGVVGRDPAKRRTVLEGGQRLSRADKGAAAKKHPDEIWFPLPRKLEDPETSGLSCNVTPGRVDHIIDLK